MQINPRCTKINFKNVPQAASLCLLTITFSIALSSCNADDLETPVKIETTSETFMRRNDSIPKNDSIPIFKDGEVDPPKGTIPPPPPRP